MAFGMTASLMAQPQKSRVQSNRNATAKKAETATVGRAALMFPTAVDVPGVVTSTVRLTLQRMKMQHFIILWSHREET